MSFLAVTPICGAMKLWTVAPAFFRSTVIVDPAFAFAKVLGWNFMVSIIWIETLPEDASVSPLAVYGPGGLAGALAAPGGAAAGATVGLAWAPGPVQAISVRPRASAGTKMRLDRRVRIGRD